MEAETPSVVLLQACYAYYLSKNIKFKIRNPVILFNLILQGRDKISDLRDLKDPRELCEKLYYSSYEGVKIKSNEERAILSLNAINLVEWVTNI